jgi:hypothetical protein
MRDPTLRGGGGQETTRITPDLKVRRQCPVVLLVELLYMIGINFLYDAERPAL